MTVVYMIAAAVITFGGWRLSLWMYPYAPCRLCGGLKLQPGSNKKRHGLCRRCGGSGKRLRWGARER